MKIDPEKITRLMVVRGWTGERLAAIAGVSPPTVSYLRRGKREANTVTLHKLADALRVSVEEIIQ